jgi:hypothetical protein
VAKETPIHSPPEPSPISARAANSIGNPGLVAKSCGGGEAHHHRQGEDRGHGADQR